MTIQEFMDKLESEGEYYAYTDYGLKEDDLDESLHGTDFYNAVRDARRAFENADNLGARVYKLSLKETTQ